MGTEKTTYYQSPVARVFEKFSRQKDVSLVYGEPIELNNKKVIPVAKVIYIIGGGGGYSGETTNSSMGQGEGGGGYISVTPLGVYEINSQKVKFKPIIDLKFILTLFTIFSFGLMWLVKKTR